jgi:hypothetical protein
MISDLERRLGFQVHDAVVPLGSFPAPAVEHTAWSGGEDDDDGDERLLVSPGDGVAGNYLLDEGITRLLPWGRATRWKLEPRILVLRGIPRPRATAGAAFELLEDRWVLDSRAVGASLLLEVHPLQELAIIGGDGTVDVDRVALEEPRRPGEAHASVTN